METAEVVLKLILATALGGLIGLERESSQKPAGFRTNILICLGATMVMILSGLLLEGKQEYMGDLTRIAAGVITGIGFMGAGTIIHSRGMVIGLTTAAGLWAVAVLGLVIGSGYYLFAVVFTAIIIITLFILGKVEAEHMKKDTYHYTVESESSKKVLLDIKKIALHEGIKFKEISHKKEGNLSIISFVFDAPDENEQNFYK
ncbi:MAG TPA: MgtC/SapB family protein, partial [Acidobacteriota bacterium]|nr:MgtC/SapB family protein [Acidobacteriota bacterium]